MNKGEVAKAVRNAVTRFDEWNEVTGAISKGSSCLWELESVIEDSVHVGIRAALGMPYVGIEDEELTGGYIATPVEPKAQVESASVEPAPKEGEKVKYMGGGMIGFACLEDESAWFRLGRWQRPGMIPQSESKEVGSASVEMSPKERQKGMDDFCTRKAAELLGGPKEVESRGLPPLSYEANQALRFGDAGKAYGQRTQELKASLLREKELRELLKEARMSFPHDAADLGKLWG